MEEEEGSKLRIDNEGRTSERISLRNSLKEVFREEVSWLVVERQNSSEALGGSGSYIGSGRGLKALRDAFLGPQDKIRS